MAHFSFNEHICSERYERSVNVVDDRLPPNSLSLMILLDPKKQDAPRIFNFSLPAPRNILFYRKEHAGPNLNPIGLCFRIYLSSNIIEYSKGLRFSLDE